MISLSEEELSKEFASTPQHVQTFLLKEDVDLVWKQIAFDIEIYFALCMLKASPKLSWGIRTKPADLRSVNKPVLIGFHHDITLDPIQLTTTAVFKILWKKNSSETNLLDSFNNWMNKIPQ